MIAWRIDLWVDDEPKEGFQVALAEGEHLELFKLIYRDKGEQAPANEDGNHWQVQEDAGAEGTIYRRWIGPIDKEELRLFAGAMLTLVQPDTNDQKGLWDEAKAWKFYLSKRELGGNSCYICKAIHTRP